MVAHEFGLYLLNWEFLISRFDLESGKGSSLYPQSKISSSVWRIVSEGSYTLNSGKEEYIARGGDSSFGADFSEQKYTAPTLVSNGFRFGIQRASSLKRCGLRTNPGLTLFQTETIVFLF